MAETVVGLRSVRALISTRAMGPNRRTASMTWKRLIARISSGSAVFIGVAAARAEVNSVIRIKESEPGLVNGQGLYWTAGRFALFPWRGDG